MKRPHHALWLCASLPTSPGCQTDLERMLDQKKAEPYEASPVFPDGKVMRLPPGGTVAATARLGPAELVTGRKDGRYVEEIPMAIDAARLTRGEQRYQVFCRPCHGAAGDALSQVADAMQLRRPVSLHEPRVVALAPGAVYQTINEGFGLMPAYGSQLGIEDRWAVVAYVQALQFSQSVKLAELPEELKREAEPWLK